MDGRALLRRLDPQERNVLLLWHRHNGDASLVAEILRGGHEVVTFDEDGEVTVTIRGRADRAHSLGPHEVREVVERARARLERMARAERHREDAERERRVQRKSTRRRNPVSTTEAKPGSARIETPVNHWAERVIREAQERRQELLDVLVPVTAELRQTEDVLRTLGVDVDAPWTGNGVAPIAAVTPADEIVEVDLGEPEPEPPGPTSDAGKEPGSREGTQASGAMQGVPEHLAHLPACVGKDRVPPQNIVAAERQLRVLSCVEARSYSGKTSIAGEIAADLDEKPGRVKEDLDALTKHDLVKRLTTTRRAEGQTAGRSSIEFDAKESPDPQ